MWWTYQRNFTSRRRGRAKDWLGSALHLGESGGCWVILIKYHHIGVNLLRQLPYPRAFSPLLLFTAVLGLLLSLGFNLRGLRQWNLVGTPERGGVRKTDSIYRGHLTLSEPELPSQKDHWPSRILDIFKSYIVVDLFTSLHCLL